MRAWPMDTPFSVADLTLQPAPVFPELYYPIWLYSGSKTVPYSAVTSAGQTGSFVGKGETSSPNGYSGPDVKLYTHPSNWPSNTKFAFEASLYSGSSGTTIYAELWDVTSNLPVANSQISTSSTAFSVFRSSQFTLTAGHTYGITIWYSTLTGSANLTDASLIIFPSAPLTSPSVSAISLSNPSGNALKEAYIPLWVYSSSSIGSGSPTSSSPYWVQKGTTTFSTSAVSVLPLSSVWSNKQNFAFEASISASSAGTTVYAELWDVTAGSVVSNSTINTTSGTFTVVRSNTFNLTPSHNYGVAIYTSNTSIAVKITKAHLVALA